MLFCFDDLFPFTNVLQAEVEFQDVRRRVCPAYPYATSFAKYCLNGCKESILIGLSLGAPFHILCKDSFKAKFVCCHSVYSLYVVII